MANEVLESGEILADDTEDATLKSELDGLALKVDIMNDNKDAQFSAIDELFWPEGKINTLQIDDSQKNEALKYALKDAKITMWSGRISIMEIANLFWKYVSQDGDGWKLNVQEIPEWEDKQYEEALKTLVSSPIQSPLAYLIQKTSNFAKIQAQNGYGKESEANRLREIKEDKALGNQTRRALVWLKSWIEWWKIDEEKIPAMTVDEVLQMKYISADLRDKLVAGGNEDVRHLWEKAEWDDAEYEYKVPYTNNYALKKKWEEESQSYTGIDVSWLTSSRETINGLERDVYIIDDISKLPDDWKWSDDKKVYWYEVKNTTGFINQINISKISYKFLNNGTCYKESTLGVLKNLEWPYDSATVINKLKSPEYTSDNITTEEMKTYVESVKTKCAEALKVNDNESLGVSYDGKKLKFTLWTGEIQLQSMWATQYWTSITTTSEKILSESFDIKQCLKWGNINDPEYWNIDVNYVENVVIKSAKENLVNQKKAIKWRNALVDKYTKEENGFTLVGLFGLNPFDNDRKIARLNTFFNKFDNRVLVLDKDTTYDWNVIKLEFDDSWWNEDYNTWSKNNDLKIEASKIVKDDYSLDEDKLKEEIKAIVLKIIEREDFK